MRPNAVNTTTNVQSTVQHACVRGRGNKCKRGVAGRLREESAPGHGSVTLCKQATACVGAASPAQVTAVDRLDGRCVLRVSESRSLRVEIHTRLPGDPLDVRFAERPSQGAASDRA